MKIRNSHISNSSSSNFLCEVCNNQESGYDACLSDFGWVECENGHVLCCHDEISDMEVFEAYRLSFEKNIKKYELEIKKNPTIEFWSNCLKDEQESLAEFKQQTDNLNEEELKDWVADNVDRLKEEMELTYHYPATHCPICRENKAKDELKTIESIKVLQYLEKTKGVDLKAIEGEIRERFSNLNELVNFLQEGLE